MVAVGLSLYFGNVGNSITIAAVALTSAVAAEALFIHMASRSAISEKLVVDENVTALTLRRLFAFHLPLTATTMVMMLGGPAVLAGVARTPDPRLALAAWPVAISLMFLLRTAVFALPEVVITLHNGPTTALALRRFCASVGLAASGLLILLGLLRLDVLFFRSVLRVDENVATMAHVGFLAGAATPFIGAMQSYARGVLTAMHLTVARLYAVLVSMAFLILALFVSVALEMPGILAAALSLTVALAAELAFLWTAMRFSFASAPE
jgi:hypothetical protein